MEIEVLDANSRPVGHLGVDALIFDLDGVVTQTASLHAEAWKSTFDEFLRRWSQRTGQQHKPFDIETDYRLYVDGRKRNDGVTAFLESRGIRLPKGSAFDPPGEETIFALSQKKNDVFLGLLKARGTEVFDDAVEKLQEAKRMGMKTAVVSASRNCESILSATHLGDCFDTRIDGIVASDNHLKGKPKPDTFLAAAERLGVPPERAVVFEDAIAGVQAGRSGGFGMVVGVARNGTEKELEQNGADHAIRTFRQIRFVRGNDLDGADAS